MSMFGVLRSVAATIFLAAMLLVAAASGAWGAATVLCVKNASSGAVKGPTVPGGSECKAGYNKVTLPGAAELEVLDKVMPYVKYQQSGIGGKPTIQVSGANVQIVNGEGSTKTTNGAGNLIIGYDENELAAPQTGSHDLILGIRQGFTSYGSLLAGFGNTASGAYASVLGGVNTASTFGATVSGGTLNKASGAFASVSGGQEGTASGNYSSISGGTHDKATGEDSSVSGGLLNLASGPVGSISGGFENMAEGEGSSLSGGFFNRVEGQWSTILGGKEHLLTSSFATIP